MIPRILVSCGQTPCDSMHKYRNPPGAVYRAATSQRRDRGRPRISNVARAVKTQIAPAGSGTGPNAIPPMEPSVPVIGILVSAPVLTSMADSTPAAALEIPQIWPSSGRNAISVGPLEVGPSASLEMTDALAGLIFAKTYSPRPGPLALAQRFPAASNARPLISRLLPTFPMSWAAPVDGS